MFAVIQTGGKQYKVATGEKLKIEKLEASEGAVIYFDQVLLVVDGEKISIGTPTLTGARVEGKVLSQGRAKKKIVFKYHRKTRYHKKKGHRQPFSEVLITSITPA